MRYIIFIILLFTYYLHTQNTRVTREWGTYWGVGNNENLNQLFYKNNKLYLVAGIEGNSSGFDDSFYNTNYGSTDLALFEIDPSTSNPLGGIYFGADNIDNLPDASITENAIHLIIQPRNFGSDIPLLNSHDNIKNDYDGAIAKYDSDYNLLWSTYFGGESIEQLNDIVVDGNQDVIVAGRTNSSNSISYNAYQTSLSGGYDALLAKLSSDGELLWSTYFGGTNSDNFFAIDIDKENNIYTAGITLSDGLGINAYSNSRVGQDIIITKFDSDGNLLWSTYYGGNSNEVAYDLKYSNGYIYLCGRTESNSNASIGNSYDNSYNGNVDGFVAKFDSDGFPIWFTYLGGNELDEITGLILDSLSNVYVIGQTSSSITFATNNSYNENFQGRIRNTSGDGGDLFFAKFNSNGDNEFISYLGGEDEDSRSKENITIDDENGFLYLGGRTISSSNIANNGYDISLSRVSGVRDNSFIAKMKLEYSINLTQTTGGSVSADNSGYIQHGQPLKIKIETQQGYTLENVVYNSNTFVSISELNIDAVRNPVNVYAVWSIDPEGDIDGDGITNKEELDAPNQGDANNDGIKDYLQVGVTSLKDYFNEEYITITSIGGSLIYDARVQNEIESEYEYPYGQVAFKIDSSQTEVEIIYHSVSSLEGFEYRKQYTDGKFRFHESVEFLTDIINDRQVAKVRLKLYDGGEGDYDQTLNGIIYDPGGPALPVTANIPFWDWWWILVLIPPILYIYKKQAA